MPQLTAFRGLRYDARAVPDLATVLCPPYDVISVEERTRLTEMDPRNAVHVELPTASPDGAQSPYEAASRTFRRWLEDGTVLRDAHPMVYLYEQRYAAPDGVERSARGFFCRLRLEGYGPDSGVLPHEATMSGPREDRFQLLCAVRTNLSPVLLTYDDGHQGASSRALLDALTSNAPHVDAVGPGALRNHLWAVDPRENERAAELLAIAAHGRLSIADGHHRYETALRYRATSGAAEAADWVLALLYDGHSGGLALLPWHRVLRGIDARQLLVAAGSWYDVERRDSAEGVVRAIEANTDPGAMGLWTAGGGGVLRVDRARVGHLLPQSASETLRWLDVSVLSSTLNQMIGTSTSELAATGALTYVSDAHEATRMVETGAADATFLLRPTPIDAVLEVAAAGEHMPAKSTFFHPKAATGLVFNPLD